ncbi:MAG: hypothetical protein ACE5QW_03930 [Thermoplasmata archaeon]
MKSTDRENLESKNWDIDENLARACVEEFKAVVEEVKGLGIEVPGLEEKLQQSVEAMEGLSNADLIPSFATAAKIASGGVQEGQQVISSYLSASDAIEKAEEFIREEYENQGDIHGNVFQHLILSPSLELLRESRICLRNGEFERVHGILEQIRTLPRKVREECQENAEVYRYCERILRDLKKEGVVAQEIEDILRISRTAFLNGRFERVKELSEVIEEKAIELREKHRSAIRALKRAKSAAVSLVKINVRSDEAKGSLAEACVSMKEGEYEKCIEFAKKVTSSANRICKRYRELSERIDILRKEMKQIGMSGRDVPRDIEEMLARAERELKKGNHQGSEGEIEIASLLLNKFEPGF